MGKSKEQAGTLTANRDFTSFTIPGIVIEVTPVQGQKTECPLGIAPITVGTSAECDIAVSDPRVSRKHCAIALGADGAVLLRDLDSKNGTFIGPTRIKEAFLAVGPTAVIGGSKIRLRATGSSSTVQLSPSASFGEAIGGSVAMRDLFAKLELVSPTNETVLLLGESGTGKGVLARAIHDASPRNKGPFVVFDCGATTPNRIEDELFGHVKGAYTGSIGAQAGRFEEAHGGTLFIDEIGELPLELQPKLLRVLQERTVRRLGASAETSVDVRVVAATNRNLRAEVTTKSFRDDLYYRIARISIRIPPLRERKDDIPIIVARTLASYDPPRTVSQLPPNTMRLLSAYDWPGNVRELENVVANLAILGEGALLEIATGERAQEPSADRDDVRKRLLAMRWLDAREVILERFTTSYVTSRLREHGGNITRAAESMGVTRQALSDMMKRHKIRPEEE